MRKLPGILPLAAISVLLVLLVGCGGDDEEAETPATATGAPAATATVAPAAQATQPPGTPKPPLSEEEARDKLTRVAVLIEDLPSGYAVQSDDYADNTQASTGDADPATTQTLLDGVGRILGHTVVYTAKDIEGTALAGQPVGYFSSVDAFQDAAGAGQYYAVAVQMIKEGTGAGDQFAEVFADAEDVRTTSVTAAAVGDESQAFALTGEVEEAGQRYPLVVLLLTLHRGRATAFVGLIQVGLPPDVQEVERLGELLVERIDEEF